MKKLLYTESDKVSFNRKEFDDKWVSWWRGQLALHPHLAFQADSINALVEMFNRSVWGSRTVIEIPDEATSETPSTASPETVPQQDQEDQEAGSTDQTYQAVGQQDQQTS